MYSNLKLYVCNTHVLSKNLKPYICVVFMDPDTILNNLCVQSSYYLALI